MRAGAEFVPFSPLADEGPRDDDCDVCWLPAVIPNSMPAPRRRRPFLQETRRFAEARPVHVECGGFMVLGQTLEDADGTPHPMLGLLGHSTSYASAA